MQGAKVYDKKLKPYFIPFAFIRVIFVQIIHKWYKLAVTY